jgi:thioesterase domain-containing protein
MRPHGPYVVAGHCNGAYVAFELARQLIDAGETVPAVIVIDAPGRRPPPIPRARGGDASRAC